MKTILSLLLSLAPLAFAADTPQRAVFPDDYVAPPCTDAVSSCASFDQWEIAQTALKTRGMHLRQEWVDAHWDELMAGLAPICRKAGACFSQPGNDWTFCNDILQPDTIKACDRYPAGSDDREQCVAFSMAYWFGHDRSSANRYKANLKCVTDATKDGERTLEIWTVPEKIGPDYDGKLTVYAIDAESHIPVQAAVAVEGQTLAYAEDVPAGKATTDYIMTWPLTFNRVPNANGHNDVAVPNLIVSAKGYKTVTMPMPVDAPKMIVTMSEKKLRRGKNTFVVEARDAVTGKPVEARVMANDEVVGDTNKPLELEWKRGEKRPEIWVTSLFDRYSDVVLVKGDS